MIAVTGGVGRPRRYCRRSHRQRAFEARRLGKARGLASGEAIVAADALEVLQDRLYVLRTALEDTEQDLGTGSTAAEVRSAYEHIRVAAGEVLEAAIEPRALGAGHRPV